MTNPKINIVIIEDNPLILEGFAAVLESTGKYKITGSYTNCEEAIKKLPVDRPDVVLMDIDLPWQDDPLRGLANRREHFMDIWHKELQALEANYTVISGTEDRLSNAIKVIDAFLSSH